MSGADRPWWATDEADMDGAAQDPLAAHRAARRGTGEPGADADDGSWWVPATEAVTRLARDFADAAASPPRGLVDDEPPRRADDDPCPADEHPGDRAEAREPDGRRTGGGGEGEGVGGTGSGHRIDACGVCPICVGLRALGESRPELVGHLAEAARQLALAVRTVVDAGAPAEEAPGPTDPPRRTGARPRSTHELRRIELDD